MSLAATSGAIVTSSGLTLLQERFAQAVISTGNASAALRQVHPTAQNWQPESVHSEASLWLDNPQVRMRIRELADESLAANQVTPDWIVSHTKSEAQAGDLTEPNHARIRALELLAKIRKLVSEREPDEAGSVAVQLLGRLAALAVAERGGGERWGVEYGGPPTQALAEGVAGGGEASEGV